MPKLIDYPRTSYTGAWELAEIIDETGGKCTLETAAQKLNRKVSGSFKAIIGSAVKFGLLTSKRELLSTTTLFKRIKHAYDKQEETLFHREAFLTPPLFTQLCRKFRSKELPLQTFDSILMQEFGVEEINAQGVAKAFIDGTRLLGLLNEKNIVTDIDALPTPQTPRRELTSSYSPNHLFQTTSQPPTPTQSPNTPEASTNQAPPEVITGPTKSMVLSPTIPRTPTPPPSNSAGPDAIASLFGLLNNATSQLAEKPLQVASPSPTKTLTTNSPPLVHTPPQPLLLSTTGSSPISFHLQVTGPGLNTSLAITEEEDLTIAVALLEKIRRQISGISQKKGTSSKDPNEQ